MRRVKESTLYALWGTILRERTFLALKMKGFVSRIRDRPPYKMAFAKLTLTQGTRDTQIGLPTPF